MQAILALVVALFFGAVIIDGQGRAKSKYLVANSSASPNIPTVNFCELIQHPDRYNQEVIRIQTIEVFDMENTFLYDPGCSIEGTYVWAKSDCSDEQACKRALELTSKNIRRHKEYGISRVGIVIVGWFNGLNQKGYGHLNGYKFSFDIMNIEKVTPVPSKTPWPWEIKK